MKKILLAVVLGLVAGWVFPKLFRGKAVTEEVPPKSSFSTRSQHSRVRFGPRPPQAKSGLSLDEQRQEIKEKFPDNPFRGEVFSMDLVSSLSVAELVKALQAGQIRGSTEISKAFSEIAKFDPVLALELLGVLPSRGLKKLAQLAIVKVCVEADPASFLQHLKTLKAGRRRSILINDLVLSWARKEPEEALAQFKDLEKMDFFRIEELPRDIISDWANRDFESAEDWVVNFSDLKGKKALMESLELGRLENLRGLEAVEFILARSENATLQDSLGSSFGNWVYSEPEKALARFSELPKEHPVWENVDKLGAESMMKIGFSKGDPNQVLEWAELLPEGESRRLFLSGAIQNEMANDIESGEKLFKHLPESPEREEAARSFVGFKMRQDPVGLAHWLGELEPSATRDGAVSRFASLLKESDPERAREWAETIWDEEERARSLKSLDE